jgi:hypothetical protein
MFSENYSVTARVKTTGNGTILAKSPTDDDWAPGATALFLRDGKLGVEVGSVGFVPGNTVVNDGNWHRIGLVWDGSNSTLYVDDIAVAEYRPAALEGEDSGLYIGAGKSLDPTSFWSGLIDDIRVYNRAGKP